MSSGKQNDWTKGHNAPKPSQAHIQQIDPQQSPLNIRPKFSPPINTKYPFAQFSSNVPLNGQKRDISSIIDLTGDDEEDEDPDEKIVHPRKKSSRSSSDSSARSIKTRKTEIAVPEERQRAVKSAKDTDLVQPDPKSSLFLKLDGPTPLPYLTSLDPNFEVIRPVPNVPQSIPSVPQSGHSVPQSKSKSAQPEPKVVIPLPKGPPTENEKKRWRLFCQNLQTVPRVSIRNDLDNSTPPLDFQFINESVLRDGVSRVDNDFMLGCTCRKKKGPALECKYPNECTCLQDSGVHQKKRHAYHDSALKRGCLVQDYLQSRYHIFECNSKCDCSKKCKNRVVQHGRQIKVELFKTRDRGWGLRTAEPIQRGQFIDTYRGEIITHDEAERRNKGRHPDENVYLCNFDKFNTDDQEVLYVCDGKYLGGPTRFMNHSCSPNCRLFTVSYNHADTNLYELAFFAVEDIEPGTELTFDYLDQDDYDDDDRKITDAMAAQHEREKGYWPSKCRCGSENCRGYFFFSGK